MEDSAETGMSYVSAAVSRVVQKTISGGRERVQIRRAVVARSYGLFRRFPSNETHNTVNLTLRWFVIDHHCKTKKRRLCDKVPPPPTSRYSSIEIAKTTGVG